MADFRHKTLYYTAKQAASKLGRNVRQIEAMVRAGRLRMVSVGNKEVIPTRAVDDLVASDTSKAGEAQPPPQHEVLDATGRSPEPQMISEYAQTGEDDQATRDDGAYYYTPKQAAEILATDLFEVDRLVREGMFPAKSVDRYRWIPAKPFENFVRRQYGAGRLAKAPEPRKVQSQEDKVQKDHEPPKAAMKKGGKAKSRRAQGTRPLNRKKKSSPQTSSYGDIWEAAVQRNSAYYTGEEAAELLGITSDDVRYLAFLGKLKEVAIDGERVFSKRVVEALLAEQKSSKPPQARDFRSPAEHRESLPEKVTEPRANGDAEIDRGSSRGSKAPTPTGYYYTPSQAAELLGKNSAAIYQMIGQKSLPAVRLDTRKYQWIPANVVIPADAVENLLSGKSSTRQGAKRRVALDPYQLSGPKVTREEATQTSDSQNQVIPGVRSSETLSPGSSVEPTKEQSQVSAEPSSIADTGSAKSADWPARSDKDHKAPPARGVDAPAEDSSGVASQSQASVDHRLEAPAQIIKDLHGLSKRTRNCLIRAGIATVPDLQRCRRDELLAIPHFGVGCLKEVENLLAERAYPPLGSYDADPIDNSSASSVRKHPTLNLPIHESFAYHFLSSRTRSRLNIAGVWSIDDLRSKSAEDLLSLDGFGAKCLSEVEIFLEAHGCVLGETDSNPVSLPVSLPEGFGHPEGIDDLLSILASFAPARRRLESLAAPSIDSALDAIEECRSKLERQIARGTLDDRALLEWTPIQNLSHLLTPTARTLSDLLLRLQYLVCEGSRVPRDAVIALDKALEMSTLDTEMVQLLGTLHDRASYVLKQRFGAQPKTLREIGQLYGVSHERVRQLEGEAVGSLKRDYLRLALPRMRTAMVKVREGAAVSPEHVAEMLRTSGLVHNDTSVEEFLLVWRAIRPAAHPFPEAIISFAATGLNEVQRKLSGKITASARRQLRTSGAAALQEIVAGLGQQQISEQDVAAVLHRGGMRELVQGYWGTVDESYAVHRAAEKMIKVCGPLRVDHIHIGALRHQQRQGHKVRPPKVLLAALSIHEAFYVSDEDVVHLRDLTHGVWPNPAEHAWLEAVATHGPVIHATTMYRALDKHGVNNGLMSYLTKHSELVQPLGEGLYCLPGTLYTDEHVEAGREQASSKWRARYGQHR